MAPEEHFNPDVTGAGATEGGRGTTESADRGETAGITIGHYRLLQKIGEGGMGEVWLAEQKEPVRRRVALKLVKAGMDTREVIGRFESERQVLALMEHPAIAKVYDAGSTPQGAPYFVMEYVAGVPITEYCDSHRLNITERLELFMDVCEGVRHAHQKAIIHRDLKPSNILVTELDGRAAPKIIDFGVAKALGQKLTEHTMFTRVGALVGTPEYMSPEQALSSGEDVDTRTDVYSLGIIFYELLAGVPPIELRKIALDEYLRRLREEDPPKPSTKIRTQDAATSSELARRRQTEPTTLMKQIGGDLDSIALKALEKDRARRYGSASDFAADIARYLRHEAVLAVPPSAAYRARKFARRHRWGLAMACAFVAVLTAAAVISIRQSVRANREAAVAEAVSNFLRNDVLAQASASTQASPSTKPDPDLKVRTALDRAAARISGKFDKQPQVEAAIRETIGQTYLDLGLYPEARTQLERALELRRKLEGAEGANTLRTIGHIGRAAVLQGKYTEAEALFGQSLPVQRRVLGAENPDTLYSLANLGSVYYLEGKYTQAEPLQKEALEIRRRVFGAENPDTLVSMGNLALLYYMQGKYPQAEELGKQVLDIQRHVLGPEHPDVAHSMSALAVFYSAESKYPEAEALQKQSWEIRRRLLGPEHPDTLFSMHNLAIVYYSEGKYPQAEELDAQTLEIQRRVMGPEHPETVSSMNDLADVYYSEGKYAQAEALLSKTLELRLRSVGPEHRNTLSTTQNLANVYEAQGKYGQAEALLKNTLEIQRRVLGAEHPDTLYCAHNLALVWEFQGKYTEAERLFLNAFDGGKRVLGEEHSFTLATVAALSEMYQREGKYSLAETYAAQALKGRRHAFGSESPDTINSASDLALAYVSQGKSSESEPLAREAAEFYESKQPDQWNRFYAESLLGASLAGQKKYSDAEPLLLKGYQGMLGRQERISVPDRFYMDRGREWLVQLYSGWGKPQKAAEWRKK
jgi:serine/threonine protein kinase/tetratricopeptide (TPR) repeat protein